LGRQRVLIVDDEAMVRELLTDALLEAGYEVAEAGDGDHAIKILDRSLTFDLLLTDTSMPGPTDGNAVATRAKLLCPDIPVLYTSGRPDSLKNKIESCDAFIPKPYSFKQVVAIVRMLVSSN
jgi:CheY-like chemotaxis protein